MQMEFDFSANGEVAADQFEAKVPNDFRSLYVKVDDKYKLDTDDPKVKSTVVAILGLNTALKASRAEARTFRDKAKNVDLSPLADFGESPDAIKLAFEAKLEEANKKNQGKGADAVAAAVAAAKETLSKQLEAANKRAEALTGQLHQRMVSGEATSALAELGAVDVDLALPHVVGRVHVVEEDGQLSVRVRGDEGQDRFSGNTGKHMTIKELVAEMKSQPKFGPLFKSAAPEGGGGRAPGGRTTPTPNEERSSKDRISAGLAARSRKR